MIEKSEFESKIVGKSIYRISSFGDYKQLENDLRNCCGHIITKVNSSKKDCINFLYKNGFAYCCTSLLLECYLDEKENNFIQQMRTIDKTDVYELENICTKSFAADNRYANDPELEPYNRNIHLSWLNNSLEGYADYCCGYDENGTLLGFGTLHFFYDYTVIGLIAIANDKRGKGRASQLIDHLKTISLQNEKKKILVATESVNFHALNLYTKNGFRFYQSEVSLYRKSNEC
jgi:dTDP-4-amino-4,6-dideoxy-D-galactose acyltransferase